MSKSQMFEVKTIILPIIFGLIASALFGIIDAIFFLTTESELDEFLKKRGLNPKIIPLIEGGISASISIFIANYIEQMLLDKNFNILKHPILDVIGILMGNAMVAGIYYLITRLKTRKIDIATTGKGYGLWSLIRK